jgi:hypothetical protein
MTGLLMMKWKSGFDKNSHNRDRGIPMKVSIAVALVVTLPLLAVPGDQGGDASIGEQLTARYSPTKVSDSGAVIQPGSILAVRLLGIKANPVSGDIYWPNSYKKGGRISQPMFFAKRGVSKVVAETRLLVPGESVYVTNIETKDADVIFSLQSCGGGYGGKDRNAVPSRANVAFQFQKGRVNPANLIQIEETIAELLAVVSPVTKSQGDATRSEGNSPAAAGLGPVYVNSQNGADRLQLGSDMTFSLQEGGQSFSGTYSVAGSTLMLHIVQLQKDVDIAMQGNRLIVNGEEVWIQPN